MSGAAGQDDTRPVGPSARAAASHLNFRWLTPDDGIPAAAGVFRFDRRSGTFESVARTSSAPSRISDDDGHETFHELRRLDPEIRVVLSSGYAVSELEARFAGEGLAGFVQKPYSYGELEARVRAALRE